MSAHSKPARGDEVLYLNVTDAEGTLLDRVSITRGELEVARRSPVVALSVLDGIQVGR